MGELLVGSITNLPRGQGQGKSLARTKGLWGERWYACTYVCNWFSVVVSCLWGG